MKNQKVKSKLPKVESELKKFGKRFMKALAKDQNEFSECELFTA